MIKYMQVLKSNKSEFYNEVKEYELQGIRKRE